LRVAHLVRTAGTRGSDTIEPYHDRVRAAVLRHLPADARQKLHRRLALALESSPREESEALALHWEGAGGSERAGACAARAAALAAEALAFDRAASLYRRSLELRPDVGEHTRKLRMSLAEALANAGRGAEAARAYLEAAEGDSGAQALDARRKAAEQFL